MVKSLGMCFKLSVMLITTALAQGITDKECAVFGDSEVVCICKSIEPITEEDRMLMAKCVYIEARGESTLCQSHVCSVLYNRYKSGKYESMEDVIYAPTQFATNHFDSVSEEDLTDILKIVDSVVDDGPTLPEYVIYFRADEYHKMRDAADFIYVDSTYFSYSRELFDKYTGGPTNDFD